MPGLNRLLVAIFKPTVPNVQVVSDAGTPGISDPGYELVSTCLKNGMKVVPVPGVSAGVTAISTSGAYQRFFPIAWHLDVTAFKMSRSKVLNDNGVDASVSRTTLRYPHIHVLSTLQGRKSQARNDSLSCNDSSLYRLL